MIRHFNKKIKCNINSNFEINEEEIYNKSLIKHNIYNDLGIIFNIEDKRFKCNNCNKIFQNKSNLNRHTNNKSCKLNNNINNTININTKCLIGFDEDWNINNISKEIKEQILLSESKFTNMLKYILNFDENLNVIIKDKKIALVYKIKENNYEIINIKYVFEITMNKIYNYLITFYNELLNEKNIDENIIYSINSKYNTYLKNSLTKMDVNNCLYNIFNDNKIKSLKKLMEIIN
jgi:stress-induced morphogen